MRHIFMTLGVFCSILMTFSLAWSRGNQDMSSFYSKSWAVVIGINAYQNFPSLEYAVNDATAIATRFKSMGFEVISLQNEQATKSNIMNVLKRQLPEKIGRNDRLVVFYAGHGAAGILSTGEEVGFIIPSDAKSTIDGRKMDIIGGEIRVDDYTTFAEKTNFISVEEIRDISDTVQAKHILYILDGCYSGFLDPAAYSRLRQSTRIKMARQPDTSRSLIIGDDNIKKTPQVSTSKSDVMDYLNVFTSRDTVQVLTAGSSGEAVYEKSGHGIFTYYLLKALDGAADVPDNPNSPIGDCVITTTELGNYLKEKVPPASRSSQIPLFNRISGEGEFIFSPTICQPIDPIDMQSPVGDTTWTKTDAYTGPKESPYKVPTQVLVDQEENLYVLDIGLHRIFKFDKYGKYLPVLFETSAIEAPWAPSSMALGSNGELWVYYSWQGKKNKKEPTPFGKVVIYNDDGTLAVGWSGRTEPLTACFQDNGTQVPFPATGLIALDIEDNLITVDQENGVMTKCDRNGKLLQQWGNYEKHKIIENINRYKTVTNPQGLAVDMFGYIYVSDTGGHGIQKYYNGEWVGGWPNFKGKKPTFFNSPHGLAVDSKLYVYVADTQNHRIKKYTNVWEGRGEKLLTYWGKKDANKGKKYGEFNTPMGVAVNWDSTNIYVADTGNKRVQKFLVERR
jgi:DNA-binding beta-propeller fold protein YncE